MRWPGCTPSRPPAPPWRACPRARRPQRRVASPPSRPPRTSARDTARRPKSSGSRAPRAGPSHRRGCRAAARGSCPPRARGPPARLRRARARASRSRDSCSAARIAPAARGTTPPARSRRSDATGAAAPAPQSMRTRDRLPSIRSAVDGEHEVWLIAVRERDAVQPLDTLQAGFDALGDRLQVIGREPVAVTQPDPLGQGLREGRWIGARDLGLGAGACRLEPRAPNPEPLGHERRGGRQGEPLGERATGDGVAHDQMVLRTDGPPNRWSSEQMVLRTDGPPNRWSSEQMVLRTDGPPESFDHEDPPSFGYEVLKYRHGVREP